MKNEEPLVSVIMTSYNTEKYIGEAIESLLRQTYNNWELLVADDASTDSSRKIIDEYSKNDDRIKTDHNQVNLHYLKTRNRLFKKSKGKYITFLDSDDILHERRLETQLMFMESNEQVSLCGCQVQHIDAEGKKLFPKSANKPLDYQDIKSVMKSFNPITGPTIFIRTSVMLEFGGYREFFSGLCSEDYDLVSRVSEKYECVNLDSKLYFYRQFDDSTSRVRQLDHPKKFFSHQIVQYLINQRQSGVIDDVDAERFSVIEAFVRELKSPYEKDPSLVYIDQVSSNLFVDLKKKAIISSLKAIWANPSKIYNYRTFKYTLTQLLKS